ncbi:MAG TPA: 5-formyltetrahydrofolate cyclo-ligase [Candidatus Paceibacterota bacterium]|jgi:hypothetical protein
MDLAGVLRDYTFCIAYAPLPDEVDIRAKLPAHLEVQVLTDDPHTNPASEATRAAEVARRHEAVVLLPGQRFDMSGTRYGRGGGWYDRFLSATPKEWLRIGTCFSDQMSDGVLTREPWDEPVDFVLVVSRDDGQVRLVETKARAS